MRIYLLCELDSEHYADAKYSFFASLDEAKNAARKTCENFDSECDIEYGNSEYRLDAHIWDDDFYVTEILPVDVKEGNNHILVWHHAYDGVDFRLVQTGTKEECEDKMHKEVADCCNDYGDYSERCADNIVDTGNEWEVWDIVEFRM